MYIVTVEFVVEAQHADAFNEAVKQQAHNSLTRETDCHQFDVCVDPQDPRRTFLYEVYTNEAAFQVHRATDHYANFSATVSGWVESKTLQFWIRSDT